MHRYPLRLVLLLTGCLLAAPVSAAVYTWTDSHGVRHYSDSRTNAQARVDNLAGVPGLVADSGRVSKSTSTNAAPSSIAGDARALKLTRPQNGNTFRNPGGRVPVALTLRGNENARLADGEKLVYYLDSKAIPQSPTGATTLTLTNVAPGRHRLRVALLYRGREVQRSAPVTFFVSLAPSEKDQNARVSSRQTPPHDASAPSER